MRKVILSVIAVLLCAICFVSNAEQLSARADSVSDIDLLCSQYTETASPNGVSIVDYINDFNNKAQTKFEYVTTIGAGTYFQNNCEYSRTGNFEMISATITGDDNITKIVPKALFTFANEKLYIGKEYGFYIKTCEKSGYSFSTVIIFDLTSVACDYLVDVKVQPIIQLDFYYIYNTPQQVQSKEYDSNAFNALSLCTLTLEAGVDNAVVPAIRSDSYTNAIGQIYYNKYKESEDFSVSDISFVTGIYNQNSLNFGDSGYDVDNDYGYFITGNSFYYSATEYREGVWYHGVPQIMSTVINSLLGFIPVYGNMLTLSDTMFGIVDGIETATTAISFTNESYNYGELNSFNTRVTQKAAYGQLLKFSEGVINSDNTLKFESNDYARGVFHISHTDNPDGTKEYTKINIDIGIKIIDKSQSTTVTRRFNNTLEYDLNTPQAKPIDALTQNLYYAIPEGTNYFTIVPQYRSNFVVEINNDNLELYINDVLMQKQNGEYTIAMNVGQTYDMSIKNISTTKQYGTFFIDCADELSNINIPYNTHSLVKYSNAELNFLSFETGNTNCTISEIFYFNTNGVKVNVLSMPTDQYAFIAQPNTDYYIKVQNLDSAEQAVTINIVDAPLFNLNHTYFLSPQKRYYEINPLFTGEYKFLTNSSDGSKIYSADGLLIDIIYNNNVISLVKDTKIYVYIENNAAISLDYRLELMGDELLPNVSENAVTSEMIYEFETAMTWDYSFVKSNANVEIDVYDASLNMLADNCTGFAFSSNQKYYVVSKLTNFSTYSLKINPDYTSDLYYATNKTVVSNQNNLFKLTLNTDNLDNALFKFESNGNSENIILYDICCNSLSFDANNPGYYQLSCGQYYVYISSVANISSLLIHNKEIILSNGQALASGDRFYRYTKNSDEVLLFENLNNYIVNGEIEVYDNQFHIIADLCETYSNQTRRFVWNSDDAFTIGDTYYVRTNVAITDNGNNQTSINIKVKTRYTNVLYNDELDVSSLEYTDYNKSAYYLLQSRLSGIHIITCSNSLIELYSANNTLLQANQNTIDYNLSINTNYKIKISSTILNAANIYVTPDLEELELVNSIAAFSGDRWYQFNPNYSSNDITTIYYDVISNLNYSVYDNGLSAINISNDNFYIGNDRFYIKLTGNNLSCNFQLEPNLVDLDFTGNSYEEISILGQEIIFNAQTIEYGLFKFTISNTNQYELRLYDSNRDAIGLEYVSNGSNQDYYFFSMDDNLMYVGIKVNSLSSGFSFAKIQVSEVVETIATFQEKSVTPYKSLEFVPNVSCNYILNGNITAGLKIITRTGLIINPVANQYNLSEGTSYIIADPSSGNGYQIKVLPIVNSSLSEGLNTISLNIGTNYFKYIPTTESDYTLRYNSGITNFCFLTSVGNIIEESQQGDFMFYHLINGNQYFVVINANANINSNITLYKTIRGRDIDLSIVNYISSTNQASFSIGSSNNFSIVAERGGTIQIDFPDSYYNYLITGSGPYTINNNTIAINDSATETFVFSINIECLTIVMNVLINDAVSEFSANIAKNQIDKYETTYLTYMFKIGNVWISKASSSANILNAQIANNEINNIIVSTAATALGIVYPASDLQTGISISNDRALTITPNSGLKGRTSHAITIQLFANVRNFNLIISADNFINHSNIAGVGTINTGNSLIIDLSGFSNGYVLNKVIVANANIDYVEILGDTDLVNKLRIDFPDRNAEDYVYCYIYNVFVRGNDSFIHADARLKLYFYGNNIIAGANGADATSAASPGENGSIAIRTNTNRMYIYTSTDSNTIILGGNGGKGHIGTNGPASTIKGDNGTKENRDGQDMSTYVDPATIGGNGSNGGNGGLALSASRYFYNLYGSLTLKGGDGGEGGKGGTGGKGAEGGDGYKATFLGRSGDGGDGGKGGAGGNGGAGGTGAYATSSVWFDSNEGTFTVNKIYGSNGLVGLKGVGGEGGDGGSGQDSAWGRSSNGDTGPQGDPGQGR